jgi:hypothetical protein
METTEANVHLGDGIVVVRRKGSSSPAIANVLGSVPGESGTSLYLDRLIHKPYESELGGYVVKGAISSILIVSQGSIAMPANA